MPKFKVIFTRQQPQFGKGTIGRVEMEVDNTLREIGELIANRPDEDLIKIEIIKLPEKN